MTWHLHFCHLPICFVYPDELVVSWWEAPIRSRGNTEGEYPTVVRFATFVGWVWKISNPLRNRLGSFKCNHRG